MQKAPGLIPIQSYKTQEINHKRNYENEFKDCLDYIDSYWGKIIHKPAREKIHNNFLNIPYSFVTPNDKKFSYIFYWDTFFMFRGLMGTKREWIMKDMIENFEYLFQKFGIIPNFSSHASVGRSQPPFLTTMILDIYKTFNNGNGALSPLKILGNFILKPTSTFGHVKWLEEKMNIAAREYDRVWNNSVGYNHLVEKYNLNRYGDRDVGYAHSSELESGWDFTSRFYNRCDEFLPVDLNCYLYKYEKDFELAANILDNTKKELFWAEKAENRKRTINRVMWNEDDGFFFDFNYKYKRQSDFLSLAGFVPMYEGLASDKQAEKMVKKLKEFETEYGLAITSEKSLSPEINLSKIPIRYRPAIKDIIKPKQWDYPNIWPPLEYLTIAGLLRYGFLDDAKRIMEKSVNAHAKIFRKYGTFFERINGKEGDKPKREAHYKIQSGFGWTNAIFYRYIKILQSMEDNVDIYGFSKEENPPYDLNILN